MAFSSPGDLNKDGFDDLVMWHRALDEFYVVLGTDRNDDVLLDLQNLDASRGLTFGESFQHDRDPNNRIVASADINGDGVVDVILSEPEADAGDRGRAGVISIYYGRIHNPVPINGGLDGPPDVVISGDGPTWGPHGDRSGYSLTLAGDVNGDGVDDLLIGAPEANGSQAVESGKTYLIFGATGGPPVFGPTGGLPEALDLVDLGQAGLTFVGLEPYEQSGRALAGGGDINGDGFADLVIGASHASPLDRSESGAVYVVFGGVTPETDLQELDGSNGFVIAGAPKNSIFNPHGDGGGAGHAVSIAGDFNGDGYDDILVSASSAIRAAGEAYVVFGNGDPFAPLLDLSALDGTNGFSLVAGTGWTKQNFGQSVSSAGDFNGDGFDDIIVSAPSAAVDESDAAGKSYLVFGTDEAMPAVLHMSDLDGRNGLVLNGGGLLEQSGSTVQAAGDINGDGFDDIVIDAPGAFDDGGGSYVVFGFATDEAIDLF